MNIEQMISQLEQQKATIERALSALRDLSRTGAQAGAAATRVPGVTKRRGRPPRNAQLNPVAAESSGTPSQRSTSRSPSKGAIKRPVYTDDFRRSVVSAVRGGMSIGEAAKKFNTTWFSVREWANSRRFEPLAGAKKSAPAGAASASAKKASAGKKSSAKGAARKSANPPDSKSRVRTKPAANEEGS